MSKLKTQKLNNLPKITQQKKLEGQSSNPQNQFQNPCSYLLSTKSYKKINKGIHIIKYNSHTVVEAVRQNKPEVSHVYKGIYRT